MYIILQEVGVSYHPQLRASLEAAGYEGQYLQKVKKGFAQYISTRNQK